MKSRQIILLKYFRQITRNMILIILENCSLMDDLDKYVYCLITHTFSNIRIFEKRKFQFFVCAMIFKSVIFYLTFLLRQWFFRTMLNNRDLIEAGCSSLKEFRFWIWVILNGFVFDESYYELYQHVILNYHSGWTWYRNLEMGKWRAFRWCGRGGVSRVSRGSWILLGRVYCLGGLVLRELLGNADVAIIGGVERFKLAHSTNSKIDRKVLQELFPEAFEATLVKTPYTFIKTI